MATRYKSFAQALFVAPASTASGLWNTHMHLNSIEISHHDAGPPHFGVGLAAQRDVRFDETVLCQLE